MSFSNERMREIERHNQILLRKILTQKPTYTLKSKSSTTSMQKVIEIRNLELKYKNFLNHFLTGTFSDQYTSNNFSSESQKTTETNRFG